MDLRLLKAIRRGNTNEIQQLADESPSMLGATTPEGNTALHIAAQGYGPWESAMKLIEVCPVTVLTVANLKGQTPLHLAAASGDLRTVSKLIISKLEAADVEAAKEMMRMADHTNGDTALHLALRNKHQEVADKLMDEDGPVLSDLVNAKGESPLYLAALKRSDAIVKRLLQFRPRNHGGPDGRNALYAAITAIATISDDLGIVKELLKIMPEMQKEADINGQIPLHHATSLLQNGTVELLVKNNPSSAYYKDKDGNMAIHIASRIGFSPTFEIIYAHCPDTAYHANYSGETILHIATRSIKDSVEAIGLKRELRSLINYQNSSGNTPLHVAILENNYLESFYLFLESEEADPWVKNADGNTALDLILKRRYDSSVIWSYFHKLFDDCLPLKEIKRSRIRTYSPNINHRRLGQRLKMYEKYGFNVSLVATIMATISFTAAFAMPGGYSQEEGDEGQAVLSRNAALTIFLISDTISMCCSFSVAYLYTSKRIVRNQELFFANYFENAKRLMLISFAATLVAFASGMYAVVKPDRRWLAILVCFLCAYVPSSLYINDHTAALQVWKFGTMHRNARLKRRQREEEAIRSIFLS